VPSNSPGALDESGTGASGILGVAGAGAGVETGAGDAEPGLVALLEVLAGLFFEAPLFFAVRLTCAAFVVLPAFFAGAFRAAAFFVDFFAAFFVVFLGAAFFTVALTDFLVDFLVAFFAATLRDRFFDPLVFLEPFPAAFAFLVPFFAAIMVPSR